MQIPIPTKTKLCPFRLAKLVQLQANNKSDESKGSGARGQYAFKLASGEYAGLLVQDDKTSSTGKTAYIVKGTDSNNVITIRNFDEAAAKNTSGNGYLGIKIDPTMKLGIKAAGADVGTTAANLWSDLDFTPENLAGKESSIYEGGGKLFTISLNQAAAAGSKITLSVNGALSDQLKAILGDITVDANGAEITLAEGQTFVSFALTGDEEIDADFAGAITASYQTAPDEQGSAAAAVNSNSWGLTLDNIEPTQNIYLGDQRAPIAISGDGQQCYNWGVTGGRDAQGNLIGGEAEAGFGDVIYGSASGSHIQGLGGNDALAGGAGADKIEGGEGDDLIVGGLGADELLGGAGDDKIWANTSMQAPQRSSPSDQWYAPVGKEVVYVGTTWGVYKDTQADGDPVNIWTPLTFAHKSRASDASQRLCRRARTEAKKVNRANTTNSIALCAGEIWARGRFSSKNSSCESRTKFNQNRAQTDIDTVRNAIEFVAGEV